MAPKTHIHIQNMPRSADTKSDPLLGQKEGKAVGDVKLTSPNGKVMHLSMPDGSLDKATFTKQAAKLCMHFPPPPGGWYGPFGFFRMVTYFFVGLVGASVLCDLDALWNIDWLRLFSSLLFGVAAAFCAFASYAHEGLANQVGAIKKQNDKFAKNNTMLAAQVGMLGDTNTRLEDTEKDLEGGLDQLDGVMDGLHKCDELLQISAMIRAFNSANLDGDREPRIEAEEFEDFWSGCHIILEKQLPHVDFHEKVDVFRKQGMCFSSVTLIIQAVLRGGDGDAGAKHAAAMIALAVFASDPCDEAGLDKLHEQLAEGLITHKHPVFADADKLKEHLQEMASKASVTKSGGKSIVDDEIKPLAMAVIGAHHKAWKSDTDKWAKKAAKRADK